MFGDPLEFKSCLKFRIVLDSWIPFQGMNGIQESFGFSLEDLFYGQIVLLLCNSSREKLCEKCSDFAKVGTKSYILWAFMRP